MPAATDNVGVAKRTMKGTAVYWPPAELDEFGKPTWGDPEEISCRWDDDQEEFIDTNGDRQMSMAQLIVDRDLELQGVIFQGTISDLTDPNDPKKNEGAWEIRKVMKTPDFKGKKYLREVYL